MRAMSRGPVSGKSSETHSTVTDLARLRGWSTSCPRAVASSQAKACSGTVATSGCSKVEQRGSATSVSGGQPMKGWGLHLTGLVLSGSSALNTIWETFES